MRYTIEASRDELITICEASSEAHALDLVDGLVAAGFKITVAHDQDGIETSTIDILYRLISQGGL